MEVKETQQSAAARKNATALPDLKLPDLTEVELIDRPRGRLHVRLETVDGVWIAYLVDDHGGRVTNGIPASDYLIMLWRDYIHLLRHRGGDDGIEAGP